MNDFRVIQSGFRNKQIKDILKTVGSPVSTNFSKNIKALREYLKQSSYNGPLTAKDVIAFVQPGQNDEYTVNVDMNEELNTELANSNPGTFKSKSNEELWIQEPTDFEGYAMERDAQKAKLHAYSDMSQNGFNFNQQNLDNEPVECYYTNYITKIEDIFDLLDKIYQYKVGNTFKLHVSFGSIYEEDLDDGSVTYTTTNANINNVKRSIPAVITSQADIDKYKIYIQNLLTEAADVCVISTKHHWCSVVNCMFAVFNLNHATGKLSFLPDKILKNRAIVTYNEDNNFCWWAAYAAYLMWEGKIVRSNGNGHLTMLARKLIKGYYHNIEPNTYKGFNISTELTNFCKWAKVNVKIYDYDAQLKRYSTFNTKEIDASYSWFNVLLMTHKGRTHVMWIRKPEDLMGILICPKCHSYCYNIKGTNRNRKKFNEHVEKCTGKFTKKLRVGTLPHPYVPHLWKTSYAKLLAHKEEQYWQPIRYYMTYDFETMEQIVDKKVSNSTVLNSRMIPLSVSLTVKSKKGVNTYFFSKRDDEEFVQNFIKSIFEHAEEVYNDNIIVTPTQELKPRHVCILGYNSGRFDMNLLIPYLNSDGWVIKDFIGTLSSFKSMTVQTIDKTRAVTFMDAMHYVTPQPLKDFILNFGSEGCSEKGIFPYEAFNTENYKEVLSKSEPFTHDSFYSYLNQKNISDEEYAAYVEDAKNFATRWNYLEYYNKLDTIGMISPLDNLIELNAKYHIDMLSNLSLSSNSSMTKYALCYKDFDPFANYAHEQKTTFTVTKRWWAEKCRGYKEQDKAKGRDVTNNVSMADFDYFKDQIMNGVCYLCNEGFTSENRPTLDRINNDLPHTKDNVRVCCRYCNTVKSDRDEDEARLAINLRKYCLLNNFPMTIDNEEVYHLLRAGITGGMSNVLHRLNIKDQTPINHLEYDMKKKKVNSVDSDKYKVTHVCGIDFNSLYPSSYSSQPHPFMPYTGGKMYMPGRIDKAHKTSDLMLKKRARYIIDKRDTLFVADLKGHIPEEFYNEFINLPPIFRNVDITTDKKTIGDNMYKYMKDNHLAVDQKTRKLTMLMSTMGEYMSFSSYYLWFLMDRCHFVIDDIRYIVTFVKHDGFNNFVNEFMSNRQHAMLPPKNKGMEQFCKISLNGSYGYDGMNAEKFAKTKIMNKDNTFNAQLSDTFINTRKIEDDMYIVEQNSKTYGCNTCLQEAYFTLDNAKYWYLNFIYNFMHKAFDMERMHFVEGDTDSMYWAISGDPTKDYHQRFEYVVKDQAFYDKYKYLFFPEPGIEDPLKSIQSEKKLLGLAIEKEGENCVALAPKCYTIWNNDSQKPVSLKLKGVSLKKNKIVYQDYLDVLNNKSTKQGVNINLQVKDSIMSKITVYKNALTASHTKMVVLENQSCVPFL